MAAGGRGDYLTEFRRSSQMKDGSRFRENHKAEVDEAFSMPSTLWSLFLAVHFLHCSFYPCICIVPGESAMRADVMAKLKSQ